MRQGVYSLPLLLAMEQNAPAFAPYLDKKAAMTDEDTQAVYQLVQTYGGVPKAQKEATRYTQKALKAIRKLPDDEQNTRELLWNLTNRILQRTN